MRNVIVELGGVAYTIHELPSRKSTAWRKKLEKPFSGLVSLLENGPDTDIDNLQDLATLIRSVSGLLIGSMDTIVDLLFEYSPPLKKSRKKIENEIYDSEIIEAFVKVLGLAFPFGGLVSTVRNLMSLGSTSKPTEQS